MVAVVPGCLGSVGVHLSTDSAHAAPVPALPVPVTAPPAGGRGRPRKYRHPAPAPGVGASYARYSSDLQDESSITQQQRKCRDRAAADGVAIPDALAFADSAVSGTKRDRAGLNALLAAAREGRFAVVYFDSLSRLARESVITMPVLKDLVHNLRVRVVSVTEGIDSARENWDLVATLMAHMHGQFLTALRAAVLRGQEEGVLNDWSVGDWCLGYASEEIPGTAGSARRGRNARPRRRVVIDETHAVWVRQVFAWFVTDRWSLDRIAKELTKRNAPKDHRSTTPGWHHDYVKRLLRNEKYVGVWGWGKATNVRNPLTGQIAQEGRPPDEVAKWVRHRPELRLVEDDVFSKAQALLDLSQQKWAAARAADGTLAGAAPPRHLLQGLVKCGACGGTFQVCGAHGGYLGCAGYKKGLCGCKTWLPRDAARDRLLDAIGSLIVQRPGWLDAVVAEARRAWEAGRQSAPDERAGVRKELDDVGRKIARLVDAVEAGDGEELAVRLGQRRREKRELELKLARLAPESAAPAEPPTRAWVAARVAALAETLRGDGPAAAEALRRLVGGCVVVTEAAAAGRKRKHLVGTFRLAAAAVLGDGEPGDAAPAGPGEAVTVAFGSDPPWAGVADAVKAAFDSGTSYAGIAAAVGCPYPWVAKGLAWWHRRRGLPVPDGRAVKIPARRTPEIGPPAGTDALGL